MTSTRIRWKRINPDDPAWFRNARFVLKSGMKAWTNEEGVPVMWLAIVPTSRKRQDGGHRNDKR